MNDRFKFRLWAKDIEMYFNGPLIYINTDGKLVAEDGVKVYEIDQKAYIIEQCTGLKDKNGKLIYEGDIVEFDGNFHGDIAWDEDAGCWAIRTTENTIYTFDNLYGYELEVVGNIHENKELLDE